MKTRKFNKQPDFQNFLENDTNIRELWQFETAIILRHLNQQSFLLNGYCKVCDKPTTFLVDRLCGSQETSRCWIPNWRERLVCETCQLNNRQRAILHAIKNTIANRSTNEHSISLYAMEQITPLFAWLNQHFDNVTGSEYLGEQIEGGTIIKGMRHENVEALSFADQSFDIILSNDVLEHVDLPEQAIAEIYRILKFGGEIFMTVPFHPNALQTVRRAKLIEGEVKHLLPPIYHGNPLSNKGSLVFNDFGWDFLEQFKAVGFQNVSLCHYRSYLYGYFGGIQYYFWACKLG